MKTSLSKTLLLLYCFCIQVVLYAQAENREEQNLRDLGSLYTSTEEQELISLKTLATFERQNDQRSFVYLNFEVVHAYIPFELPATSQPYSLSLSYPFIEGLKVYQQEGNQLLLVDQIGLFSGKNPKGRTWRIDLAGHPAKATTYYAVFSKFAGKPLATDATLYSPARLEQVAALQNTLIGTYFGLTFLAILFALFIYWSTRYRIAILYSMYLIALGVYMGSYLGYFNLFLPADQLETARLIYVLSIEFSTLIFVLFAQQLLEAKKNLPLLKRTVEIVIGIQVAWRLIFYFIAPSLYEAQVSLFMKIWYLTLIFLIAAVIFEIVVFLRKERKIGILIAISYLFMTTASVLMLLHHSFGLVKVNFFGLSQIIYASAFEILFLTLTMALILNQIYGQRNQLANQLMVQQQKSLHAFVQGQEEERQRLGAELHDNIGSRLSHIRRLYSSKSKAVNLEKELDQVCDEIRDMAHAITPAELSLVGLPAAIDDLLEETTETEELQTQFNSYQFPADLNKNTATHLYRIVQELLQNVLKHAEASQVNVQLFGHEQSLTLSFEDDGKGMPPSQVSKGIGLQNIQSRVNQMKGQFVLDSQPLKGTSILIVIPL